MAADPKTRTSRAGRVRDAACHQRGGISSRSHHGGRGRGGLCEDPATSRRASTAARLARAFWTFLRRSLRRSSAPWSRLISKHEEREEDDEDEAGVGDDLVVGLAPPALAAVVGQRGGREHQQGHEGGGQHGEQTLHRLLHRIERGRHGGPATRAARRRDRGPAPRSPAGAQRAGLRGAGRARGGAVRAGGRRRAARPRRLDHEHARAVRRRRRRRGARPRRRPRADGGLRARLRRRRGLPGPDRVRVRRQRRGRGRRDRRRLRPARRAPTTSGSPGPARGSACPSARRG